MTTTVRWTSRDLEAMPDDGRRYEIIDGELFVSKQPHLNHQHVCLQIARLLADWNEPSGPGLPLVAPGLVFASGADANDDDVVPDVVWISSSRLATALGEDGKLHLAPELAIEVLSPGASNIRRDREAKLKLYSRRGVSEYWIVDWHSRSIEIYRRENGALELAATLTERDTLESPVLPGFSAQVAHVFRGLPAIK